MSILKKFVKYVIIKPIEWFLTGVGIALFALTLLFVSILLHGVDAVARILQRVSAWAHADQ